MVNARRHDKPVATWCKCFMTETLQFKLHLGLPEATGTSIVYDPGEVRFIPEAAARRSRNHDESEADQNQTASRSGSRGCNGKAWRGGLSPGWGRRPFDPLALDCWRA